MRAFSLSTCAGALVALLSLSACSADPVKTLERQAVGMRPRLLESCLPEAGRVEIEGDVERLTYAWALGEPVSDGFVADVESGESFRDGARTAAGAGCEVTLEIDDGLVRKIEVGGAEPSETDVACATRVRSCLAQAKAE